MPVSTTKKQVVEAFDWNLLDWKGQKLFGDGRDKSLPDVVQDSIGTDFLLTHYGAWVQEMVRAFTPSSELEYFGAVPQEMYIPPIWYRSSEYYQSIIIGEICEYD